MGILPEIFDRSGPTSFEQDDGTVVRVDVLLKRDRFEELGVVEQSPAMKAWRKSLAAHRLKADSCGATGGPSVRGGGGFRRDNTCARGGISRVEAEGLSSLLKRKGGFTYQPIDDTSPKDGFAVSTFPEAETVVPNGTRSLDDLSADVFDFLKSNRDRFDDQAVHAGGWYDVEAGKIYLDLSVVEDNGARARRLARQHNQEGIFDLSSGETIIVKEQSERRL